MTKYQHVSEPSKTTRRVISFIINTAPDQIPRPILETTALYLLDLIGVLAAAGKMEAARIAKDHAVRHWAAGEGAPSARLAFDGRRASLPGASFAMATQLDNLDAHDGWQASKGHAGCALLPALLSLTQPLSALSGKDFLATLAVGYEVSNYAALALHETVEDYHTSGAWNAIGCAAMASRLFELDFEQTRHAIGIAEYHGPRSQMMREIANPSMLHDGSSFGAAIGVYAALAAQDGFLGAPAATLEFDDAAPYWKELGQRWTVQEQYIKPYPICRWAHAAIDTAMAVHEAGVAPENIERVEVETFANAAALSHKVPKTPHEAQYTMAWAVACALVRGRVGVDEILEPAFQDPALQRMTSRISSRATETFEARYPEERAARVRFMLRDGSVIDGGDRVASGGPVPQPSRKEVEAKFRAFAGTVLGKQQIEDTISGCFGLLKAGADARAFVEFLVNSTPLSDP